MFQKTLTFGKDSYIEIASRVADGEEKIVLTLVGPKNANEITASQAFLNDEQVALLAAYFTEALNRERIWPIK